MANQHLKKYDTAQEDQQKTWRENWEVMRPFVHFAFKAITIIGGALIGIIKLLPALLEHKDTEPKKNNKIIKI